MAQQKQRVAVVGASPKPERYSNRAVRALMQHGHDTIPVHPAVPTIEGLPAVPNVADLTGHIDTLTLYVSPSVSTPLAASIINLRPGRVIFNPGTENPELQAALQAEGIPTENACTLILLNTNQF
jgi:predicted CoA-binding protein